MDGTQFDTVTQRLAVAATRRRIVGGVLGGAALLTGAALAGMSDADARRGKGKAKGKGKGKGNGRNNGKGKAHGKNKIAICHENDDGVFVLKKVPSPALKKGHRKHGDTVCGEAGVCQTGDATGCDDDGACEYTLADEGTPCEVDGVTGTCSAEGECMTEPV